MKIKFEIIILSHCYYCNITSEHMKQPHSTLNGMHAIMKCANMESMNGENTEKLNSTQDPVTPFDIEWTHHYTQFTEQHPLVKFYNYYYSGMPRE